MQDRPKHVSDDAISALVDRALDALSTDRARAGVLFHRADGQLLVDLGGMRLRFTSDDSNRMLAWERLVDALPATVERARLRSMLSAADEEWGAPWSVYTTATAAAWLLRSPTSADRDTWISRILAAANQDASITIKSDGGSSMEATLRTRRLDAEIQLSQRVAYNSTDNLVIAREVIPHTVAVASDAANLADIVDIPWVRDCNILVDAPAVGSEGTRIRLREPFVPLAPIPTAAMGAAPATGPEYAPWIVTQSERLALDTIDEEAHR